MDGVGGGERFGQSGERLEIAESTAYRAVCRVMDRTRGAANESAEELRRVEQERLDALTLAIWPQAQKGNFGAIDRVLRLMARRAALLGLDAPQSIDHTTAGLPMSGPPPYVELPAMDGEDE